MANSKSITGWTLIGTLGLSLAAGCANVDASQSGQAAQDLQLGGSRGGHGHDSDRDRHCDHQVVARDYIHTDTIPHGLAGDASLVFVSQPLIGEVDVFDRATGNPVGTLQAPAAGFALAFALRIPSRHTLAVLDIGGFPTPSTPAIPTIYEYHYDYDPAGAGFTASITRTIHFDPSLPIIFADDFDFTPDGGYVVSESSIGALWLVSRDGTISQGIFPASTDPADGIPALAPCDFPGTTINGVPYNIEGGFAPGVGALTVDDRFVYFASTCTGGVARVPLATLHDASRTPTQRAADIQVVTARAPGTVESIEGLSFDRFDRDNHYLYATDDYNLRVIRIDVNTGRREVVADDPTLFDFPVTSQFLPPRDDGDSEELLVLSDQEYRFSGVNTAISGDLFHPPFIIASVLIGH